MTDDRDQLLRRYGIDRETVEAMYREWSEAGVPKSVVEARHLRTRKHHGKLFNRLVRTVLGKETEAPHPLRERVEVLEADIVRLRAILERHGIRDGTEPPVDRDQLSFFEGDGGE